MQEPYQARPYNDRKLMGYAITFFCLLLGELQGLRLLGQGYPVAGFMFFAMCWAILILDRLQYDEDLMLDKFKEND